MTSQITANGTQRLPEPVSEHEAVPPPPPTAAGRPRPPTSQLFSVSFEKKKI